MIVVDTSALITIIRREPLAVQCATALDEAESVMISAGTLSETYIVAGRNNGVDMLEDLMDSLPLEVVPVDEAEARRVGSVFRRWGRGSPDYCLNFGDCFAYALASRLACPLLFIGNDFSQTDILSVLPAPGPSLD